MKGDWSKDRIEIIHKLLAAEVQRVKQELGCDQVVIVTVFNDGDDRHLFDSADSELRPVDLYTKLVAFHLSDMEVEPNKPANLN